MPSKDKATVPPPTAPRTIDEYFQSAYDSSDCWRERWHYALVIGAIGLSSAADATEIFSIGYILGDEEFQNNVLHGDLAHGGAVVAGILNLGLIVGGFVAASAESRFGRKPTILLGLSITTLGGVMCAASSSVFSFSACRFVVGLGIGAILSCNAAIATELSPPRERGLIVSTANSFWTAGIIGNSIWAYLIFDVFHLGWRIYLLITIMPSIVALVLILWLVPESPRFLAVQGKYTSAALSANLIATAMGYEGPLLQVGEIAHHYGDHKNLACRAKKVRSPPLRIKEQIHQSLSNVRKVYQGELRKPVITIQVLWVLVSMGSALALWINTIFQKIQLRNVYLNFIFLNCSCVLGNIASALLTDRIGRNTFFTMAMTLASASLFSFAILASGTSGGNDFQSLEDRTVAIVLCTSFYYAGLTGVYTVLYVIVSELFPTNVRATGAVLCSTLGRLASTLAMFINGALIDNPAVLLSSGASVLLSGALLSWLSPPQEMRLQPVHDDFDRSSLLLCAAIEKRQSPMESHSVRLLDNDTVSLVRKSDYRSTS